MKNLIHTRRKELGLRVFDLAHYLGVDSSLVSRIISGKRKATIPQLKKLSEILHLDFHILLKEYLSNEVIELLSPYPQLAEQVMVVAEERITYLRGENKFKTIALSCEIEQLLEEVSQLQLTWQNCKPLHTIQVEKMKEYFHTAYTFESNRIEGNTLTLSETHLVVNEGITVGGKSLREHLEVINHHEAIDMIHEFVQNKVPFNAHYLKQIHHLVLKGIDKRNAGVYRSVPVRISGSAHVPPEPYMIDKMMEDYFIFYETKKDHLHPVLLAAEMHERLVSIHPFIDGNGRTSRLVMNLILLQNGYTLVNLKGDLDSRLNYYKALESVQVNHEREDFYTLILERVKDSLTEHIHLAG